MNHETFEPNQRLRKVYERNGWNDIQQSEYDTSGQSMTEAPFTPQTIHPVTCVSLAILGPKILGITLWNDTQELNRPQARHRLVFQARLRSTSPSKKFITGTKIPTPPTCFD